MRTFDITRTSLVTQRWRVQAEDEDQAFDVLASADTDDPDVELLDESHAHPQSAIEEVFDYPPTCILTGLEDPDDCTMHAHE